MSAMDKPRRLTRKIGIKKLALFVTLLALAGVGLYVAFLRGVPQPPNGKIYPPLGARIGCLQPLLRWEAQQDGELVLELYDEFGQLMLHETPVESKYQIPPGLLQPGKKYRWKIIADESVLVDSYFSINEALSFTIGKTHGFVFPSKLYLTPEQFTAGATLLVGFPGPYEVRLPKLFIFPDGTNTATAEGETLLRFYFNPEEAPADPFDWESIKVFFSDTALSIDVTVDPNEVGRFIYESGVHFDPYKDTPGFSNFTQAEFARLTNGTCLGITLIVKFLFERCTFGEGEGIPADLLSPKVVLAHLISGRRLVFRSVENVRELSNSAPQLLKELMSAAHFENLDPTNIAVTIKAITSRGATQETVSSIKKEFDNGRLALLAAFTVKKHKFSIGPLNMPVAFPESGHTLLAYRMWRFSKLTLLAVFDPNLIYRSDSRVLSFILISEKNGWEYYLGGEYDPESRVFALLPARSVLALLGLAVSGSKQNYETVLDIFFELLSKGEKR